jgi:twitching motility two-component system response regulator PilG
MNPQQDLILIVEDSVTVRAILEMHLSQAGYACLCFADGVNALQWLSQKAEHVPRLLLLDLGLPRMDGYQVAQHIRAQPRWNDMVLVMLTGRDGITDRLKGRLSGAQVYLTKPFRVQQLLMVVQNSLHGQYPLAG